MNQDRGRFEPLPTPDEKDSFRREFEGFGSRMALGNDARKGHALTAAESALTEKSPDGWPTLAEGEQVSIKGVWFRVTKIKLWTGQLRLQMMTTEEVEAAGQNVIRPEPGDVLSAIQASEGKEHR